MRDFILGTDWWTDCDDAVAVRLLARAVRRGEVGLLGVGINACMADSVASMDGFLRKEGLADIPLGIDLAGTDFGGQPPYQKRLAQYARRYRQNEEAEDAVRLYRRLLAQAKDKVEIVEIGFLQVIAGVLQSGADEVSDKTGMELVREKVERMWVMAGKWDGEGERENNFCRNARASTAAEAFCRLCPVPVTFLGWEVGVHVLTGGHLLPGDVLGDVLRDHGSAGGRHSWDPMLMLLALTGDTQRAGYDAVRGWARVDADTGANFFQRDVQGRHQFVVKAREDAFYSETINALIE